MVKIITDTTSCLPAAVRDAFQIPVVPQMIHFGQVSFTEGVDLDLAKFLGLLRDAKELPKTSAPPPELFSRIFAEHHDPAEPILCIHPSADLSGTVRSAETARLDFPALDIRVIDTRLVASPLGVVVHQAAIWAGQGLSADEVVSRVHALSQRCRILFLVATLEYLAKGGRIGGASALMGNALQIKPILTLIDGRVEQHSKERTFKKALARIKTLVAESYPAAGDGYLTIMHADQPQLAADLARDFRQALGVDSAIIGDLPPAIITHVGPGSIALGYFESEHQ